MNKYYIYPALIVVLIICSCGNQSETPVQVAERMKAFACAGDVEGFYTYVDKLSVESNLKNIATQRIREDIANTDDLEEFEEVVIPSLVVLKWEIMNRELKSGEGGVFCNMQAQSDQRDENSINIVFPDGQTSTWHFEKRAGQLILVSILDEEPFDFAGLGLQAKAADSFESKNRVTPKASQKTEDIDKPKPSDTKQPLIVKQKSDSNIVFDSEQDKKVADSKKEPVQQKEKAPKIVDQAEPLSSAEQPIRGFDFGVARWGMTRGQVISLESSSPISKSANSLKYVGRYNGLDAELEYVFSNDRLIKGRYLLLGPHTDETMYLRDYKRIEALLTGKFGKPQINEERWTNSLYKDNPDRHGFAVYIGHLSYRAKWTTNRSKILLELKSNNYNMLLEALYSSR